jgi:hypothetical protein
LFTDNLEMGRNKELIPNQTLEAARFLKRKRRRNIDCGHEEGGDVYLEEFSRGSLGNEYVGWARELYLNPEGAITRSEALALMARALKVSNPPRPGVDE